MHTAIGQQQLDGTEHLKMAQQCFQIVGASASECDTIPGRASRILLATSCHSVRCYSRDQDSKGVG